MITIAVAIGFVAFLVWIGKDKPDITKEERERIRQKENHCLNTEHIAAGKLIFLLFR